MARAKDVLVLKIKERRAFNVPWNLSAAHYELKTSEGAASPGRRGRGQERWSRVSSSQFCWTSSFIYEQHSITPFIPPHTFLKR